jgi:hypothetical protein
MLNNVLVTDQQLRRLDDKPISTASGQISCFVGARNEFTRLPYFLDYHRRLGVDRFFVMDNSSTDGTREFVLEQADCHCFHTEGSHFALNIDPPNWTNALLNVFGVGNWCVVLDADELLVYPECERVPIGRFCNFLEDQDSNAMSASMIDMYADGPATRFAYRPNQPFVEAAPFFDPKPGWLKSINGVFPPVQMFGGVRERLFWHGRFRNTMPPCLSKVPLVKWRGGMRYLVAQHLINQAVLAPVTGALLHFKFMTGFQIRSEVEIKENAEMIENTDVEEKSLQERKVYLETLMKRPNLTFRNSESARFDGSNQLVKLGWIKSSTAYDDFLTRTGG